MIFIIDTLPICYLNNIVVGSLKFKPISEEMIKNLDSDGHHSGKKIKVSITDPILSKVLCSRYFLGMESGDLPTYFHPNDSIIFVRRDSYEFEFTQLIIDVKQIICLSTHELLNLK